MNNISIKNIRKSYQEAPDTDFYKHSLARYFFRPISFYLSIIFLKLKISPNQVTILSWVFALAGCFAYCIGENIWSLIGFLFIIIWALLDYVDGSMARFLNQRTSFGHFIDVVGAYYVIALLPICLAIGVVNSNFFDTLYNYYILIIGAFSSILSILLRLILAKGEVIFGVDGRDTMNTNSSALSSFLKWVEALMSPRGIHFPLLIICTIKGIAGLTFFILFYFLYNAAAFFGYMSLYLNEKYKRQKE